MKKFICVSPFQPPKKLGSGIYIPSNNDALKYGATSFPIIPVINAYAEDGEEITVITVLSDYDNARTNYETFKTELKKVEDSRNINIKHETADVAYNNDLEIQLGLFSKIIGFISDGDKLYCDITFGSKVMNQILTMSVNYGYRVRKDVMVGCMVYGEKDHSASTENNLKIYDITSLIYLDEIVRLMAEKGVGDPTDAIKMLMNWEDEDD